MSTLLTRDIASMLETINQSESVEAAIKIVKQIAALKTALESVELFREQSVKYARLEAEALIKVVELGGLSKLRGSQKTVASWLAGLAESEREKYISMCLEGLTVAQIYKREVGTANEKIKQMKVLQEMRKELISELESEGITDITPYANHARKVFWDELSTANDLIDGVRKAIRKAGGAGIGEDTGVYVRPDEGNQEEIKKAILLRFNSVRRDLEQIKDIAAASKAKMCYKDFLRGESWELENDVGLIHLLIWLNRIGLVDGEAYDAITKADFRREMDYVHNTLGISKANYIRILNKQLEAPTT